MAVRRAVAESNGEAPTPPPSKDDDPFMAKVERSMSWMLDQSLDFKDRNALFANAIKFLAIKHKLGGEDGGDFFGD